MNQLLAEIKACTLCQSHLAWPVNPVVRASADSKIIIIGQAPGRIVHQTSVPWNDKSGDNLREWLGVTKEQFYDTALFELMTMGFFYHGTGVRGDLPPRPECAATWHKRLLAEMPNASLTLLVGQYAQNYYLQKPSSDTLTQSVRKFRHYLPAYFPLPHPSPRNNLWQAKNPWFRQDVLPELQSIVQSYL